MYTQPHLVALWQPVHRIHHNSNINNNNKNDNNNNNKKDKELQDKGSESVTKYQDLVIGVQNMWDTNAKVIPIVIGALGY